MHSPIYNQIFPKKAVTKGLVEVICTSSEPYYTLALDGKVVGEVERDTSLGAELIKRRFIKEMCKKSGVSEDELVFVHINWEDFFYDLGQQNSYDSNQYTDDYKAFIDAIKRYGLPKAKNTRFMAKGIDELEAYF